MTLLSASAAHALVAVSQANAKAHNQRHALYGATVPRVEFIYTPAKAIIDCTFNDLCGAWRTASRMPATQNVEDLDTSVSEAPRRPSPRRLEGSAAGAESSHNGQYVTLEPRPRYNMSHWGVPRRLWHGRCLYNYQERQTAFGEWVGKHSELVGSDKKKKLDKNKKLNKKKKR